MIKENNLALSESKLIVSNIVKNTFCYRTECDLNFDRYDNSIFDINYAQL